MLTKTLLILLGLIAIAVPVAASLAWLGLALQWEAGIPLWRALGDTAWQNGTDFLLVAIPMFVMTQSRNSPITLNRPPPAAASFSICPPPG